MSKKRTIESKAFDHGAYIEEGRSHEAELTAREHISSFIARTPEDILTHPLTEEELDLLKKASNFGREPADTPNRRLAMAMLELEESVRVMYALRKGKVASERTIEDAETGKPTTYEFRASRAGSDFGMNLVCDFYAISMRHLLSVIRTSQHSSPLSQMCIHLSGLLSTVNG